MSTRAYIRESTVEQGTKFGPDAQRAAITRACEDLGVPQPEHFYTDLVTGTGKTLRDSLAAARADAAAHEYDVLVCYDTSRWARNEREAFDFEYEMKRAGVRIYYAAERIWSDDESKALHKGMLHVINAEYSRALSRRVRDAYASKRAKGEHVGAIPWGYRRVDGVRLEPTELVQIRLLAWQLYADGDRTFATVADELNRQGHRITHRGVERTFTRYTIEEFFKRRVDVEIGGLDPETYARARLVAERNRIHDHVGQRRNVYVFAGLVRCAECGERFSARIQHKGAVSHRQLVHAPRGCAHGTRNEERLERVIAKWLQSWRLPADARTKIARYAARGRPGDPHADERRKIETELERLRNLYRWGDITEAEYVRDTTRAKGRLGEIAPQRMDPAPSEDVLRLASRLDDAWLNAGLAVRRRFLTAFVQELRIARSGDIEIVPVAAAAPVVYAALDGAAHSGAEGRAHSTAPRRGPNPRIAVGSAGAQPTVPHPVVTVAGIAEWREFWAAEASA